MSLASDGSQTMNGDSFSPSISSDGRYVAFGSEAGNLLAGDSNNEADVFLRDTCLGASVECVPATIRVSVADDGSQVAFHTLHGARFAPSISGNGRFVAFTSASALLVAGDTNGFYDVFVRDTCIGAAPGCLPSTSRVSLADGGSETRGGDSVDSAVSSDGRFIAFGSSASNLVPSSSGARSEIFLRDTCAGVPAGCTPTTRRISAPLIQYSVGSLQPVLNADGRFVLFLGGNEGSEDGVLAGSAFLHDACTGAPAGCEPATLVVSQDLVTQPAGFIHSPAISADGGALGFASSLSSLVAGDNNAVMDVFIVRLPRP